MANSASSAAAAAATLFAAAALLATLSCVHCAPVATATTAAGHRIRRSSPPPLGGLPTWQRIQNISVCPAELRHNGDLNVTEVWCADGVEGKTFAARNVRYVCRTVRYSMPYLNSDVEIAGGCVARLVDVNVVPAQLFTTDN